MFCQRGSNYDNVFLVDEGRFLVPLYAGHNRPASETPLKMVFHWRAEDGPT